MKTLAILLLFASTPAFAFVGKNLRCKQNDTSIDNGYEVLVTRDLKKAFVSEQTFSGPEALAELTCVKGNETGGGDQIVTIASCSETELSEVGYSLQVEGGGIAGLTTAKLFSLSNSQRTVLAEMTCRYLNSGK